jgi:GcrA cell cycle regulator
MAIHAATSEFRATLGALGITPRRAAALFGVGPRSVRRWQDGNRRVPRGVRIVLRLLAAGTVTISQVEQAAAPTPARTNGSAKPKPSAPLLVEPAPARAKAATRAGPSQTTADAVYALAPEACRWPCGDPGHPDFHFCGGPVAKGPYCEHHRAMAYVARPTGQARLAAGGAAPGALGRAHSDHRLRFNSFSTLVQFSAAPVSSVRPRVSLAMARRHLR